MANLFKSTEFPNLFIGEEALNYNPIEYNDG